MVLGHQFVMTLGDAKQVVDGLDEGALDPFSARHGFESLPECAPQRQCLAEQEIRRLRVRLFHVQEFARATRGDDADLLEKRHQSGPVVQSNSRTMDRMNRIGEVDGATAANQEEATERCGG